MEDINILGEYENIELTTLLRTFKREGIENFVVVRKNNLENLIKAYKELEEENKRKSIEIICYQEELENSIPVSLVEEKIEELKEEIEQLRIESNITYDSGIYRNQIKIDILQELLERRK